MKDLVFCEQKEENLDTKVSTCLTPKKDRNPDFNTCRLKAALLLLLTSWRDQFNELFEPYAVMQKTL